jgi:hypothetical protein
MDEYKWYKSTTYKVCMIAIGIFTIGLCSLVWITDQRIVEFGPLYAGIATAIGATILFATIGKQNKL